MEFIADMDMSCKRGAPFVQKVAQMGTAISFEIYPEVVRRQRIVLACVFERFSAGRGMRPADQAALSMSCAPLLSAQRACEAN